MKITEFDIEKEGFAVLHGKWGGVRGSIIGINTNPKLKNPKIKIGYLAYPNPKLKNNIPERKFYSYNKVVTTETPPIIKTGYKTTGKLEQSVTKIQYIKKIKEVKELLAAGEIYQLNYAVRFRKKFEGSPYALFLQLSEANPADFAAYINCGKFHIISSSPERFFKVKDNKIITEPIKGTVPKKGGKKSLEYLLNSEKERAELDMITDLERNDVGKICKYGTLKLTKERRVLELKNLWHTYSEVQGDLPRSIKQEEVIEAMFPGGSITGCPKKRAMYYIEKLEGLPRNIFTGSIGFMKKKEMDFNIAIRTALVKNGYIEYWAGGGIVADSDPEKEYEECLLKAEKFLSIL